MAAGAVRGALRQQDIEALMDGAPPERPLPMYYFLDSPDNPTMRITAFIVRLRAGGMMVAMPGTDEVGELLSNLSETGDPSAPLLFTPLQVACETPRRRGPWADHAALCGYPLVLAGLPEVRGSAAGKQPRTDLHQGWTG